VATEGAGFESSTGSMSDGGDDHNLVFDNKTGYLYELYQANLQGGTLSASGVFIWDPSINYPVNLRGDVCTSADASGALMAPLLATPDEVAAGTITHALRLILPNSRIQNEQYVRPATHGTGGAAWATMNGIPYGARFRLHSDFTLPGASPAGEVFITALKTYGMFLSDGGDIALSVANDDTFNNKWATLLPNGSHELYGIDVTDFDIVAPTSGTYINFTSYTCVRTQASLIPGTTP
jgi:serine/threonine-protein kinase